MKVLNKQKKVVCSAYFALIACILVLAIQIVIITETWQVQLVTQEQLPIRSTCVHFRFLCVIRAAQSLVWVVFCAWSFVLFYLLNLYCLSLDLRLLLTPLVSSIFSE
jgi:hypothetical protein